MSIPMPPPPPRPQAREIHPVELGYEVGSGILDFRPRVRPADEVEVPKDAAAISSSSEAILTTEESNGRSETQETLPLTPPGPETEQELLSRNLPPAQDVVSSSQQNFLLTGSSPTSTGKPAVPVPPPNIK